MCDQSNVEIAVVVVVAVDDLDDNDNIESDLKQLRSAFAGS